MIPRTTGPCTAGVSGAIVPFLWRVFCRDAVPPPLPEGVTRARFLVVFATLVLLPAVSAEASPEGWRLAGCDASSYSMDRDSIETYDGKPSGSLSSVPESRMPRTSEPCRGYGTMCQCIDPGKYAGKRVRFSGYVKAKEVKDWAGLWMRVDGPDTTCPTLAFDNMSTRAIKGSRDWARYDVVLDVAPKAKGICFGILLHGQGNVWLSGVSFETVSMAVPTTGERGRSESKPTNLEFAH